jgi:hypothetical protein
MPCYEVDAATLAEERRIKEEREQQIEQIEQQLEAGIVTILQDAVTGTFTLVGATLPTGMFDACVLAELEKRNSQGFQMAVSQSDSQTNFVALHDRSHGK